MKRTRRSFLEGAGCLALAGLGSACAEAAQSRLFTPEMFGAKGDGRTNDSRALAALAAAVNAAGGGTVEFRAATYIVGEQAPMLRSGGPSFEPRALLEFSGCRAPLILRGNGARLRCASGLRYGIFNARTGEAVRNKMPYIGPGVATPYRSMIRIERCSGRIEVSGFELDGNVAGLRIGGQYGDTGWQIPAIGLSLYNNRGAEIVRDVHTHHHAQDGFYIDGDDDPRLSPERRITNLRSEYNGRQGCSIVGGRGYVFENCSFNHTGRSSVSSAPGAGVDIEAEGGKTNRDFRFVGCEFSDNAGAGMVADTGDSEGASLEGCTFIGTTSWSAWPGKPRFRFRDCKFVGALARAHGDDNPARAAQFAGCEFRDDPRLSPTRTVYGGTNADRPLADLSDAKNVLFSRCAFLATHEASLPWSTGAIYADCRMEQRSPRQSYPRGRFVGRNIINGNVDLYGSRIEGEVLVNGRARRS